MLYRLSYHGRGKKNRTHLTWTGNADGHDVDEFVSFPAPAVKTGSRTRSQNKMADNIFFDLIFFIFRFDREEFRFCFSVDRNFATGPENRSVLTVCVDFPWNLKNLFCWCPAKIVARTPKSLTFNVFVSFYTNSYVSIKSWSWSFDVPGS